MYIEASAPTRIDLAGGTLDIWPLYLFHEGAQTLNAAIGLRARCSIAPRTDRRIVIVSGDTGLRVEAEPAAMRSALEAADWPEVALAAAGARILDFQVERDGLKAEPRDAAAAR